MNPLDDLLGPLATIECQRAVRPRWLLWVRLLASLPAAGIVLLVTWSWMLLCQVDSTFLPGGLLAGGLVGVEVAQILLALLLGPALIAGAIAGEKDRGTLSMLLASRLTSRDIVLGRLAGCFSQVAILIVAGFPPLVLLAALCGVQLAELWLLIALPTAVTLGSAGLTVAASTLARRGRDALLTVYVIEVLLLIAAYVGAGRIGWLAWLGSFNPFAAILSLAVYNMSQPAAMAIVAWICLGAAGATVAVWQLRPAFRRQTGGDSGGRRTKRRRVPPIADRPMLWKELHLERSGSFGAFGRWMSGLLAVLLAAGGGMILAALAWEQLAGGTELVRTRELLADAIIRSATLMLWLVQWMLGLRAIGGITSERQRSTWDALLCSPLEAKDIIKAKAYGSIYALRWLIAAICLAWTAAALTGEMPLSTYLADLALLAAGGAFMVAAGVTVGISMSAASTTRGMAEVIGLWLAAAIITATLAGLFSALGMLLGAAVWATLVLASGDPGDFANGTGLADWVWPALFLALRVGLYLAATALTGLWIAGRFDRLAGRMGDWSIGRHLTRFYDALVEPIAEENTPEA